MSDTMKEDKMAREYFCNRCGNKDLFETALIKTEGPQILDIEINICYECYQSLISWMCRNDKINMNGDVAQQPKKEDVE